MINEKYKFMPHQKLNGIFRDFCENGNLKEVKYLLTNSEHKADIGYNNYIGFTLACSNGHLELVKYLLTSPDLKDHVDIHADNDIGFKYACVKGHLNIVKYLLTSPGLKKQVNIYATNNDCRNYYYDEKF